MTVQEPSESKHDPMSSFQRRKTSPASTWWNGKEVETKVIQKSYSYYINPLHLKHNSETDVRQIISGNGKQEKHPNSARSVSKTSSIETRIPYAVKQSSINRNIQRFLLKEIKSNNDHLVPLQYYQESFIRICYESVDDIFENAGEKSLTELTSLVENSIAEAKKRIFCLGSILIPVRDRLTWLKVVAEEYIQNELKERTSWTDEFLTQLSLINEYLNPKRMSKEGENRIQFFLNLVDRKIKDSVICGIIWKAIQPFKEKTSKLTKLLGSFKEADINDIVMDYYFKKLRLTQKASEVIKWEEPDNACCRFAHVNRSGMVSSLYRDFVNTQSTLTINGKVVDVKPILKFGSDAEKMRGFFEEVVSVMIQSSSDVPKILDDLLEKKPTDIDHILWSCCFHAWANPEVLIQEKFMTLHQNGYAVMKGLGTDCSVEVDGDLNSFEVNIRKLYRIYPTDKKTGIKDESQPLLQFICSWQYRPQEIDSMKRWSGKLEFQNLQFIEGVPLQHREMITELLVNIFQ